MHRSALFLFTIAYAISIYGNLYQDGYYYDIDLYLNLNRIASYLFCVARLSEWVGDVLLLVTFAELGNGFVLYLANGGGGRPSTLHKPVRYAALSVSAVLLVLSIAAFGLAMSFYSAFYRYYSSSGSDETPPPDETAMNKMTGAVYVLLWIVSLPLIAYASYVVHRTKHNLAVRNVRRNPNLSTFIFIISLCE